MKKITKQSINEFKTYLSDEEKSSATLEKYIRDILAFSVWLGDREINKSMVLEYKARLMKEYAPTSVNSILSSLNSFFVYKEWTDCRVKTLKIQKQLFTPKSKELTKAEYKKLLHQALAENNKRLYMIMQTICSTGIRVSELRHITVESVRSGLATINCKGKMRMVMLTKELCKKLNIYIKDAKIKNGPVFVSKNGKPLDRSNIWSDMKRLCEKAGVSKRKVFPHNLRHLFARTFYSIEKDIVRLADILGHANVNTTRIYTMESGEIHRKQLQKLGLLLC